MNSSERRAGAREEVLLYCRRMMAEHLAYYTAGNISKRVDGEPDLVAVTPASLPYDTMRPEDICIVSVEGELVEGERRPTSEFPLHTLVYARRPEVGAIVHTHSPAAMAMAALGLTLPPFLTGLVGAVGGDVRTAPYSRPGTAAMADCTADALHDRGACFLRFHGVLAVGRTLARAYNSASVVEGAADAYLRILPLGEVPVLPTEEIEWLAGHWRSQWARAEIVGYESRG
ncbi:MAG: class II aldolase/adducin family protein [Candidatus Limnocylindrales bacterium]